jgi:hypothetical protein
MEKDEEQILDNRFQSYLRFYIHDLLNASLSSNMANENTEETSANNNISINKRNLIRVNNLHVQKVSVSGMIVDVFENPKFYRCKVDDSTGCVSVTLWKSIMFDESSLEFASTSSRNHDEYAELYKILSSIRSRVQETNVNNCVMYEPKRGDLVVVRGVVNCFKQRIEISAHSCTRVQSSTEEMIHMMLPSVLAQNCYSIEPVSVQEYEQKFKSVKTEINESKSYLTTRETNKSDYQKADQLAPMKNKDVFINFVNKKLIELTTGGLNVTKNASLNTMDSESSSNSCNSYSLFSFLRNNCPVEFKYVSHKQVLSALKELELMGLAYSCEDEFHYLPIS